MDNRTKRETRILTLALIVLFGLALVVVRFGDEIDGVKHSEMRK